MIVTINSQALAAELRLLNRVVPSKPVIQILSHVLLRADGDTLSLYATDLEVGVNASVAALVTLPGTLALPAAKLLAMVEQFPDADVSISKEKGHVLVKCGAFKFKVQAMSPDDFPPQQQVEGTACTLEASTLRWLFDKARHATASSATRHVLNGALLKMTGSVAAIVATDGKRLLVATAQRQGPDLEVIVPSKTVDLLSSQLTAGPVELTKGARHLFFTLDGRLITSRTIDGAFPAYERIVPRDNDKTLVVDRSMLTAALRRVILAADENDAVYLGAEGQQLTLTSASAGVGSADESFPLQYEGPPIRVCINGRYVLDFLEVMSEPTVTLRLKYANGAALLQDGRDCFSVIMLMRV